MSTTTTTSNNIKIKKSVPTASSSSAPNSADVSPIAKLMMEQKHSHSAKCLLLPRCSPLHYDSPLLRRNAKMASSGAGALFLKLKEQEVLERRGRASLDGDHHHRTYPSSPSSERSGTGTPMSAGSRTPTRSPPLGVNFNDEDVNCTMFEVEEWGSKRWIRLEVIEPVTITAKNFLHLSTSFTTYLIRIETNHYAFSLPVSEVRRRYSEFCWLRRKLSVTHPNKVIPPLPPKHFFNITNFNENIINQRRYGLGKFLQRVFRSSVLLSDSALHLFLQTDLSTKEIDARVSEEQDGSVGSGSSSNNNNIPLTGISLIDKRPYLFRSVSLSSSPRSDEQGGTDESGGENSDEHDKKSGGSGRHNRGHHSDDDGENYCDISSSEEYEIDVEA